MGHADEEGGPQNGAEDTRGERLKFGSERCGRFPGE